MIQLMAVPSRTYEVGTSLVETMTLPRKKYAHADVTCDFSEWKSAATTRVAVAVWYSPNGGRTWKLFVAFDKTDPPVAGAMISRASWTDVDPVRRRPRPIKRTHIQCRVTVEGEAVTFPITVNVS